MNLNFCLSSVVLSQIDEYFLSGEKYNCDYEEPTLGFNDCKWQAIEKWLDCELPWVVRSNSE